MQLQIYFERLHIISNQILHYTRRITPKRVTSWRCPSPRHSAKATCVSVEAVANRLQRCVRFGLAEVGRTNQLFLEGWLHTTVGPACVLNQGALCTNKTAAMLLYSGNGLC